MADEQTLDTQAFGAGTAADAADESVLARVQALEEQLATAQDQAVQNRRSLWKLGASRQNPLLRWGLL